MIVFSAREAAPGAVGTAVGTGVGTAVATGAQGSQRKHVVAPANPAIVTTKVRRLERGETLYAEGEDAVAPYLVLEGVLRVIVTTASGQARLADLAGPGDMLATAVFEGRPHGETVVAADSAKVAQVDLGATLLRPAGRLGIGVILGRQVKRSRELADDLGLPMGARICRILARVARRLGRACDATCEHGVALAQAGGRPATARPSGALGRAGQTRPNRLRADQLQADRLQADRAEWRRLPFSLTHDDVALMAGCARVTATRVLGELKASGALVGHRGDYALVPSALDEAADEYVYEAL